MDNKNKTVITGMGMITALGLDVEENWKRLCEGQSAVKKITSFDTTNIDTKIAAEAGEEIEELVSKTIGRRERKQMTKNTKMAMIAAAEAIEKSGIDFNKIDRTRVAVIMGIVTSNYSEVEQSKSAAHFITKTMPNAASAWISIKYGIEGPNFNVSSACASSAYAIILGKQMIEAGIVDVAVVGGSDASVEPRYLNGFNQILAMSVNNDNPESASRPFTLSRDGFVMGEGSGVLVIESEESAKKRNAKVYAEIAGVAFTSEAEDITAPKKDGVGMARTMQIALDNAGISYKEVDYINAHGTSTYLNDKYETMAIKKCFRERAKEISISSSKSMLGHTIASAGVIEGIISVLSINNNKITPTINYHDPDPELDLDYTPNVCRNKKVDVALSNSFGFGGHNASLVFKKYSE